MLLAPNLELLNAIFAISSNTSSLTINFLPIISNKSCLLWKAPFLFLTILMKSDSSNGNKFAITSILPTISGINPNFNISSLLIFSLISLSVYSLGLIFLPFW